MKFNRLLENYRDKKGWYATDAGTNFGAFWVPFGNDKMRIIADDGTDSGWEHVSCSFIDRCPTWDEMCRVKDLFWDAEECAVQYHPPKSEYVNNFPYCLHLWRKIGQNWETPPREFV
jgi:hypothetical protein